MNFSLKYYGWRGAISYSINTRTGHKDRENSSTCGTVAKHENTKHKIKTRRQSTVRWSVRMCDDDGARRGYGGGGREGKRKHKNKEVKDRS